MNRQTLFSILSSLVLTAWSFDANCQILQSRLVVTTVHYLDGNGFERELLPPDSIIYLSNYALEKTMRYNDVRIDVNEPIRHTLPDQSFFIDFRRNIFFPISPIGRNVAMPLKDKKTGYNFFDRNVFYNNEQIHESEQETQGGIKSKRVSFVSKAGPYKGCNITMYFRQISKLKGYAVIPEIEKRFNSHLYKIECDFVPKGKYIFEYNIRRDAPNKDVAMIKKLSSCKY